jgi:hypothetical protein
MPIIPRELMEITYSYPYPKQPELGARVGLPVRDSVLGEGVCYLVANHIRICNSDQASVAESAAVLKLAVNVAPTSVNEIA